MNEVKEAYTSLFRHNGLDQSRILSFSKSNYRNEHPNDLILFNANVLTTKEKVWYGDINLSQEENKLQDVAKMLCEDLYVLSESDCRFETENLPIEELLSKAVKVIKAS